MLVLHAHWQPPRRPADPGGILFWAETSSAQNPTWWRGRLPKKISAREHPYVLTPQALVQSIGMGTPLAYGSPDKVRLLLPSTRSGPIPAPELIHEWVLDIDSPTFLLPWYVPGVYLPSHKAFSVLANLPARGPDNFFVLGQEVLFWQKAANLVLETLAQQKFVPVLTQVNGNGSGGFQARWQPLLDGTQDGIRLVQLTDAMPPLCRSEANPDPRIRENTITSPFNLLDSFLRSMCDALVRAWGRPYLQRFSFNGEEALHAWIEALFDESPIVHASPAQLQALASSLRAWIRNLQASGDSIFRITFRLEAPAQTPEDPSAKEWQIHYLLQARDDPSLLLPAEEVWRARGNIIKQLGRRFEKPQEKLLAGLGYAARLFPPLLPSLQTSSPTGISLDTGRAYQFLRETAPLLEQAGFGLLVPPWWNKPGTRLGVRLRLKPFGPSKDVVPGGKLSLQNLVSYQWELAIGDTTLTKEEFEALAALKQPLVQIRGQWVQLDSELVEAAIHFWESQNQNGEFSLLQVAQFGLGGQGSAGELPVTDVVAEGWVAEWLNRLSQNERMTEFPQPATLKGQLRPYQRYGFSWLAFFHRWGMGACLADDMGLGKTIQTLALLLHEKEIRGKLPGPVLLICPTSVVTNWEREIRRFSPSLTSIIHQGPTRPRGDAVAAAVEGIDLVLSSYAVVRMDAETLQKIQWYGVVLDEAQYIKNPAAKQTQAVRKLPASFRFALTGTPVENRLSELWSIMQFLNPGYLGSQDNFRRDFSIPIERFGDKQATQRLRQLVGPFVLRRVKTDPTVIQDLPEKIEVKEYCRLTDEQATLYEAIVREVLAKIASSTGIERKGLVLSLLMQLKQICNHPIQYLHQGREGGLEDALIAGRSGKLKRLVEMLEEIIAEGERTLIFTQFAEMGHILAAYLPKALGCSVLYLHGGTPTKNREQMIRRFQEDENGPPIFILSLKAGGLGLNLMRATHVFHFDRWWNPAVEDQATDRAYRIGQNRNVEVHKFVTEGTLEERIDDMIESKKGLAEAIFGSSEQWLTEISTEELRELVRLRK